MKKRLLLTAALLAALLLCGCSLFKSAQSLLAPDAAATEESLRPAEEPTEAPAEEPTEVPTEVPTEEPTEEPTEKPFGAEDLAGVWTMSGMLYGDREYSAAELEIESYFEFHEDGTVYCVQSSEGLYDEITMSFDVSGYDLTFHDRGEDVPGTYDPLTDTILMEDEDSTLIIKRDPDAQIPQKKSADTDAGETAPAAEESGAVGTWKLSKAKVLDMEIPAEEMGQEMTFVLYADGTAEMLDGTDVSGGLRWELNGETLSISAYTQDLFDFIYDGTTLTLPWSTEGADVELIFEKADH